MHAVPELSMTQPETHRLRADCEHLMIRNPGAVYRSTTPDMLDVREVLAVRPMPWFDHSPTEASS